MPVNKLNPVCGKQLNLHVFTAESKCFGNFALPVHNAIAWYFGGIRIYMQGIAYNTCPARIARKSSDLPVGCNFASRNFANYFINFFKHRIFHSFFSVLFCSASAFAAACIQHF